MAITWERLRLIEVEFFHGNPRLAGIGTSIPALENLFLRALRSYDSLPVFHNGQSKEIRKTEHQGILIQKFSPTIYSYFANRAGILPGTDAIRLAVSRIFWHLLHRNRIATCSLACAHDAVLITEESLPPVEVIVKTALIGTPAHTYHGLFQHVDRFGRPFVKGESHEPYVRFDYRNPLRDESGNRLRDECLPLALADRLINVAAAEDTALKIFSVVQGALRMVELQCLDMCLFLNTTGDVQCGEISPDNMRIKDLANTQDYDKDLWRKGKSGEEVVGKWKLIQNRLEDAFGTP